MNADRPEIATVRELILSSEISQCLHTPRPTARLRDIPADSLIVLLKDADPNVRARSGQILGYLVPTPASLEALRKAWNDPVQPVRLQAMSALLRLVHQ